jgi:hypothetical protein
LRNASQDEEYRPMTDVQQGQIEESTLDILRREFDIAHAETEAQENALAKLQAVRSEWRSHHDSTVGAMKAIKQRAHKHIVDGGFLAIAKDAAEWRKLQDEIAMVREGLEHLDLFVIPDQERVVLTARLAESNALVNAERQRQANHRLEIEEKLSAAAETAGSLELSSWGPIDAQLSDLVRQAELEVSSIKKRIQTHDSSAAAARRAALENGK